MASGLNNLDLISNITCLTSKKNHEEALRILKKVATMVRPIMKVHGWKTHTLAEFYPKGLLGMNTNRGWKIQLCLRYHHDENLFLPWEEVIGTMLHELAHNIRGPHDAQFYKALDSLNDEYDKVIASGYTGLGFDAAGHRLGTKHGGFGTGGTRLGGALGDSTITGATRAAAVLAAEKRRQVNEIMLPAGGRRLGEGSKMGSTSKNFWEQWHSPGELAAMAAERRAKDQVWCGSSATSNVEAATSNQLEPTSTFSTPQSQQMEPLTKHKRKSEADQCLGSSNAQGKKSRDERPQKALEPSQSPTASVSSTLASTVTRWFEWACPA
ncbi:hypothetical protein BGZ54_007430, partial [Gamsiella multidivaricata]